MKFSTNRKISKYEKYRHHNENIFIARSFVEKTGIKIKLFISC